MTELYIDGVCVTLPAGFTVTVKRENPFFTKNGEYTYDIALPLTDPVNARLYGFLNRLNSVDDIKTRRRAVLRSENRVFCDGTEVVTGWTDKQVNIQLVSGNSELNYFIGADQLISSLQMCETNPVVDGTVSKDYVEKTYPDVDFNLMMTYDAVSGTDFNKWILRQLSEGSIFEDPDTEYSPVSDIGPYDYIPQPFLCAYLRELLKALGYTLVFNAIEQTAWRFMYIVHSVHTYKWNEMLPGWKIKDFLEEVEKFFNASFLIDPRKREARLVLNNNFIAGRKSQHIAAVIDDYTVECDEEPEEDVLDSNLSYDFPSETYYKLRAIPDNVWTAAKHKDIVGDRHGFFLKEGYVPDTIYYDPADKRSFINLGGEGGALFHHIEMVNEFAPLKREGATSDIQFRLLPARMSRRNFLWSDDKPRFLYSYFLPTANSGESASKDGSEPPIVPPTVTEMVETMQDSEESQGELFLAFFSGLNAFEMDDLNKGSVPVAYTDKLFPLTYHQVAIPFSAPTFNLSDMAEVFYRESYDIDFKNPVRISSWDPNLFDSQSVVEIRNRRYLCKEVEYVLDAQGRCKPWSGLFYPIRISDTEADARWILADGKWRDGGVWLDSGRWLDE